MEEQALPWFLLHDNPEELYTTLNYLVLDFETDSEEHGSALHEPNDIVLACWQVVIDGEVVKIGEKFGGIYEQQELLDDIAKVDFIVAQNAKFELQWLRRCGLELRDVLVYDTMLAQWVLDGNRKLGRKLGQLAKKYKVAGKIDLINKLLELGVRTRDIHPTWMLEYCHADVESCKQVFLAQQQLLSARKQWHLVHVRNLTCAALADIEFEGLNLDPSRVQAEYVRAVTMKEELGGRLAEMTQGLNLNSPKQLAEYIYNTLGMKEATDHRGKPIRTPKGEPTVNAKVLPLLKPETEEQKEFFKLYKDYNKQTSLLEKNLEYFKLTCEQRGGRFFGLFMQGIVQTHRLASSGIPILFEGLKKPKSVQMQNIPREYKSLFWSGDEDWEVLEADGAQLEFRVAVDEGQDTVGLKEIEDGVDIHSYTAKVLLENGDPEIVGLPVDKRRQESKKHTFRPLFGGGSGSKALVAYCEFFKDKYKGISATQRGWALKTVDKKQFTTPYGMIFYFPNCKMQRSGYITDTTSIYNYPIQGFATGEIIPIALVYFWHRTRGMRVKIFSTIHDSIASKVHKDEMEQAKAISKQALTYDVYEFLARVYKYNFKVPLGLGTKSARNWGDTKHEDKYDVWPDGRELKR
jgi:DNA polymerase I-like protein with 3'-5' exonuclease and polymerase domains